MKTIKLFTVLALLSFSTFFGQKASDVLEDAINMKNSQYILFDKTEKKESSDKRIDFEIVNTGKIGFVKDSIIFLVGGNLVKTFITPLNPLDYSFEGKSELKPDEIDVAAADALKSLTSYADGYVGFTKQNKNASGRVISQEYPCKSEFDTLNILYNSIKKELENDLKTKIAATFQNLKNLDFVDKSTTKAGIDIAKSELAEYLKHYTDIDLMVELFKSKISEFGCGNGDYNFVIQGLFEEKVKDIIAVKKEQFKRVENLKLAYNSVNKTYELASNPKRCGDWCLPVNPNTQLEKVKLHFIL
ncbi:hypothetical protein [Flavobacterium sp. 3HN19-14]|uniref:hypothetical protein n=1 Tax=Flavobacterium sp. 3HN19-14 TaxID=3448133 RepID=UPI003EDF56A7